MSLESLAQFAARFDDAFLLVGLAILLIESVKTLFQRKMSAHKALDMLASLSTQIPFLAVEIFLMGFIYVGFVLAADAWVSWTFPVTWWVIALGLIAADFIYYWEHRLAHEIRIMWTQHAVHHSSRHMNILVGVRFGPFESALSAVLHFPLILIGFPPEIVFAGIIIVLAYQTWIHTEIIGKLGPLDWFLNTPSNHRVHHGCDEKYIDKNYGGILMIWDQIFGTYQKEEETPKYGLARDYDSINPLSVWVSEIPGLFRDLGSARSLREALGYVFRPPGWKP